MQRWKLRYLTASILAAFTVAGFAEAQSWRDRVPEDIPIATIRVFDASGKRTEIYLGIHREASYGYDYHLGELPVPPAPVTGVFEARFDELPGHLRQPPGGCYIDIRGRDGSARVDTFIVRAQPLQDAWPITLAWDTKELAALFQRVTLTYRNATGDLEKNMLTTHSAAFNEEDVAAIMILATHRTEVDAEDPELLEPAVLEEDAFSQ